MSDIPTDGPGSHKADLAELRALRLELLSLEGQCIEEHHWKGNCPAEAELARINANASKSAQETSSAAQISAIQSERNEAISREVLALALHADAVKARDAAKRAARAWKRAAKGHRQGHLLNAQWYQEMGALWSKAERELEAWKARNLNQEIGAMEREIRKQRATLQHLYNVLGPEVPNSVECGGCSAEWHEALRTLRTALGITKLAKWFDNVGQQWNGVKCVACELDRDCEEHPSGTKSTTPDGNVPNGKDDT